MIDSPSLSETPISLRAARTGAQGPSLVHARRVCRLDGKALANGVDRAEAIGKAI